MFIDGNNNGTYERANDRVLEKLTNVGNNDFVWDGRSDAGTQMPAAQISLTFSSGVGPVNFPVFDCEAADFGGITVRQVRPGAANASDYVFYNDSLLASGFSTPQINPIGNNSATGGHRWSTAGSSTGLLTGDNKLVNTYAAGPRVGRQPHLQQRRLRRPGHADCAEAAAGGADSLWGRRAARAGGAELGNSLGAQQRPFPGRAQHRRAAV